jgi:hypothetical protein
MLALTWAAMRLSRRWFAEPVAEAVARDSLPVG